MEERKVVPEQAEDVIELFDIVEPLGSDTACGDGMALSGEDPVAGPEPGSAPCAGCEPAEAQEAKDVILDFADIVSTGMDGASLPEEEEADVAGGEECSPGNESCSETVALPGEAASLGEQLALLEARLAAAEKTCQELAESVETLSQQLAQAGAMFMEDAAVRLNLEEMVSRMLDARLPAPVEGTEEKEERGSSSCSSRLDALEKRVTEWETGAERRAAAAAAQVIRDEISAMRAESAASRAGTEL